MGSIKLKTTKKHVQKRAGRSLDVNLNLTPMIDMFVVLVIFLLMTFSTSGEILFIQKDVTLPTASQTSELEQAPVIIIGSGRVVIDGKDVGQIDEIKEDESFEIADLTEVLNNLKRNFQQLHPNKKFEGKIVIQGDKSLEFSVLKKVMFTCTAAGYLDINFAVLPTGKSKGVAGAEKKVEES